MAEFDVESEDEETARVEVEALDEASRRPLASRQPVVIVENDQLVRITPSGKTVLKNLPPRQKVSVRTKWASKSAPDEMPQEILPTPLDYSRPFFKGDFRYRSTPSIVSVFLITFVDIATIIELATHRPFPPIVLLWPAIFSTVAIWLFFAIVNDLRRSFSIEAGGVISGGRLVPWSKITRFGAFLQRDHITLFFTTKKFPRGVRVLMSSNMISRFEYEALVDELSKELKSGYPKLEIGGYEKQPQTAY
jgi:hypothetical protein